MTYPLVRPLFALGALSLLAACGDGGSSKAELPTTQISAPATNPADTGLVQTSVTTDIFEIDASRVALERSQNWDVRQYAQKVIDTRSKAGGELQVTLNQSGLPIKPSTNLPADKAATVAELRTIDPAKFDKLYLNAAATAQGTALDVVEKYVEDGANPALKAFAEKKAPELREQQAQAKALAGRV